MNLFIDNKKADIDRETVVSISIFIASVTKVETGKTGYSKTIRIPTTSRNMEIMGDPEQINSAEMFNQAKHSARIEVDGMVVIEGSPMLVKCETDSNGTGWYHINIIGAGKEWVNIAASSMMKDIAINYSLTISPASIMAGWRSEEPVKFLPVQRDTFSIPTHTILKPVRMLTFQDYHPFINAKAILEAIAAQAGYTINSQFLNTDFFKSLYMSGKYPEKDVTGQKERMGFLAKRFAPATAVADRFGRVYANPFTPLSSVGNIVDTANPEEEQAGVTLEGVYNSNDCFRKEGNRIAFHPVESINVGFEYTVKYRSDYVIKNREELKCFDRLYLDDNFERQYKVMNTFEDQRQYFMDRMDYMLIVFGHAAGSQYRVTYDRITNPNADMGDLKPSDYTTAVLKEFSTRTTIVGTQIDAVITNPQLQIKNPAGTYVPYESDWALYPGNTDEAGQVDVVVTARSSAQPAKPSQPRYFHLIHFGGADPGMSITVSNEVSIKPIFMPHPAEGDTVDFPKIAAHEIRQLEIVNALKQMFNLYFYTDTNAKVIYIEPREQFYGNDTVVDWSDKIDLDKPVEGEELGSDMSRIFTLRYQSGDGAVSRWNESNGETMGRWSAQINNLFAKDGEHTYYNPIFTATLNKVGEYPDAEAATFIQVGDRNRSGVLQDSENLNFPPKIVSFTGMKALPNEQWWGWPSYGSEYPMAVFHNPGENPSTLCFEDRDGVKGLNSYYNKNIEAYNTGKRITAYIRLNPEDVEPFIQPNDLKQDFRAIFKLRINGENVFCRLEEICDYNPASKKSTKCIFLKNV